MNWQSIDVTEVITFNSVQWRQWRPRGLGALWMSSICTFLESSVRDLISSHLQISNIKLPQLMQAIPVISNRNVHFSVHYELVNKERRGRTRAFVIAWAELSSLCSGAVRSYSIVILLFLFFYVESGSCRSGTLCLFILYLNTRIFLATLLARFGIALRSRRG